MHSFFCMAVSHNQFSRHPTDPARSQHIIANWSEIHWNDFHNYWKGDMFHINTVCYEYIFICVKVADGFIKHSHTKIFNTWHVQSFVLIVLLSLFSFMFTISLVPHLIFIFVECTTGKFTILFWSQAAGHKINYSTINLKILRQCETQVLITRPTGVL